MSSTRKHFAGVVVVMVAAALAGVAGWSVDLARASGPCDTITTTQCKTLMDELLQGKSARAAAALGDIQTAIDTGTASSTIVAEAETITAAAAAESELPAIGLTALGVSPLILVAGGVLVGGIAAYEIYRHWPDGTTQRVNLKVINSTATSCLAQSGALSYCLIAPTSLASPSRFSWWDVRWEHKTGVGPSYCPSSLSVTSCWRLRLSTHPASSYDMADDTQPVGDQQWAIQKVNECTFYGGSTSCNLGDRHNAGGGGGVPVDWTKDMLLAMHETALVFAAAGIATRIDLGLPATITGAGLGDDTNLNIDREAVYMTPTQFTAAYGSQWIGLPGGSDAGGAIGTYEVPAGHPTSGETTTAAGIINACGSSCLAAIAGILNGWVIADATTFTMPLSTAGETWTSYNLDLRAAGWTGSASVVDVSSCTGLGLGSWAWAGGHPTAGELAMVSTVPSCGTGAGTYAIMKAYYFGISGGGIGAGCTTTGGAGIIQLNIAVAWTCTGITMAPLKTAPLLVMRYTGATDPSPSPAPGSVTIALLQPLNYETFSDYLVRLRAEGWLGNATVTTLTVADPTTGPSGVVSVTPTGGVKYAPAAWPTTVPTITTTTNIAVEANPVNAPIVNPGSTCDAITQTPVSFAPLTSLTFANKFPFGVFSWAGTWLGTVNTTPVAPSITFPDVTVSGRVLKFSGGTTSLAIANDYMSAIRLLITFALWVSSVWYIGTSLLGFRAGGDPGAAMDDDLPGL